MPKLSQARGAWERWCDYGGIKVLIARFPNPDFSRWIDGQPALKRQLAKGDLDGEKLTNFNRQVVSRFVIKNWREMLDESGEPLPYSQKACLEILEDSENIDFLVWAQQCAREVEEYRAQYELETLGNSNGLSTGI